MDPIVCKGDPTTLSEKSFRLGNNIGRFVVSFPSSQLSVRVYQGEDEGWWIYRYIDYIPDPTALYSNIVYKPSSALELLVMAGMGVDELETLAQHMRPGKEQRMEKE